MKKYRFLLMVGLCIVSMACTVVGQQKIIVSGKVIDSNTGTPVSQALVLLSGLSSLSIPNDIGGFKYDSTYSNADGTFKDTVTITGSILLYGAIKDGYDLSWNYVFIPLLSTNVNAPTIKLLPVGTSPKDTFMVSGTVVDSVTNKPIDGAQVILTGMSLSMTGDTVLTDANGIFSKQAIVSRTGPRSVLILIYAVSKHGYDSRIGQNQPNGKQVKLGTIKLAPRATGVLPQRAIAPLKRSANAMSVFTLSGKRLYAGPARQLDRSLQRGAGVAVVRFTQDNSIAAGKIVSVK